MNINEKNIGVRYKFKLYIDRIRKKIKLLVIDQNGIINYTNISWSFDLIEEKLNRKLKYLAVIKADCKIINSKEYFKYYDIRFYRLKSFEEFITLIENGIIRITFRISVFKNGPRFGQIHDRGTSFDINEVNIEKLYSRINL